MRNIRSSLKSDLEFRWIACKRSVEMAISQIARNYINFDMMLNPLKVVMKRYVILSTGRSSAFTWQGLP